MLPAKEAFQCCQNRSIAMNPTSPALSSREGRLGSLFPGFNKLILSLPKSSVFVLVFRERQGPVSVGEQAAALQLFNSPRSWNWEDFIFFFNSSLMFKERNLSPSSLTLVW